VLTVAADGTVRSHTGRLLPALGLRPDPGVGAVEALAARPELTGGLAGALEGQESATTVEHGGYVVDAHWGPGPDGVGAAGVFSDATPRRRAERQADEVRHLLDFLTRDSPAVLFVGRLADLGAWYISPNVEDVLGYRPDELRGDMNALLEAAHPDDLPGLLEAIGGAVRDGTTSLRLEFRLRHKDGRYLWLFDTMNLLRHDGQVTYLLYSIDITDRVEAETRRHELETRLRQAERLEALGRLAGGVAHDFNNLLAVIHANVGFILDDLPAGEPPGPELTAAIRAEAEDIRAAATRATDLTARILAFGRRQAGEPLPADLGDILGAAAGLLRRVVGEHVEMTCVVEDDLCPVLADTGQVEQVLANLAANARDAMPGGGRLRIEVANTTLDADEAGAHHGVAPGRYVRLAVTDTGTGMPDEVLAQAFEPFFTTKNVGAGTGLGLATVQGIVAAHGGHVFAYSEPGAGTTVKVYLPVTDTEADRSRRPLPLTAPDGHGQTILLTEHDDAVREAIRRTLTRHGYRVVTAADADDALAVAHRDPPLDLLLTAVVMPGRSGTELARALLAVRPELPVLFMSGYPHDVFGGERTLPPGARLVAKPFADNSLLVSVAETLAGRSSALSGRVPGPGGPRPPGPVG
jgi:PAS domain S-box-containing protein